MKLKSILFGTVLLGLCSGVMAVTFTVPAGSAGNTSGLSLYDHAGNFVTGVTVSQQGTNYVVDTKGPVPGGEYTIETTNQKNKVHFKYSSDGKVETAVVSGRSANVNRTKEDPQPKCDTSTGAGC